MTARRAAKVDVNQPALVADIRALGMTVQHLHSLGQGCPDILVGVGKGKGKGKNYLFEIKNPEYDGKLTADEQGWHDSWRGQVAVVETIENILEVVR